MKRAKPLIKEPNWKDYTDWDEDTCFDYFMKKGLRHWVDIADDGRRITAEILDMEIEENSPADFLISAVAAQAQEIMRPIIKLLIGRNKELENAIDHYLENPSISFYKLKKTIKEHQRLNALTR